MGAQIAKKHDPEELERVRHAEKKLFDYYGVTNIVKELNLNLENSPFQDHISGVNNARVLQVGSDIGTPLLFVHGGGGSPADFAPMFPHLYPVAKHQSFRCLFVERPGHGVSDPYDYSACIVDEFAAFFLAAVVDALRITRIRLVGSSFGGAFTVWFAKVFPDKVESLTLLSVPALFQEMQFPWVTPVALSWAGRQCVKLTPPKVLPAYICHWLFLCDLKDVPAVFLDNMWSTMCVRNNALSFHSFVSQSFSTMSSCAWTWEDLKEFQQLSFPVLLIQGCDDPLMTSHDLEAARDYIGSDNVFILGKSHMPWLEDPEGIVSKVVDFWKCTEGRHLVSGWCSEATLN